MFEKASRMKLRFGYRGECSVEELWDLPLEALDGLYGKLSAKAKSMETDSLLKTKNSELEVLALQIDIIKNVVSVKLAEKDAAKVKADNKLRKQKILEIIASKQDDALKDQPVEELQKLLADMG